MTSALIPVWASGGPIAAPDATKIGIGWELGEKPKHEWMNWWQNGMTLRLNHVLQQGVPEWISSTAYPVDAFVKRGGLLYKATAANQNSAPPSANWMRITQDAAALTAGVLPSARLAGSYLNIQAMEGSSTATFTAFISKLMNGFRATPQTEDATKADYGWVGFSGHGLRLTSGGAVQMLVGGVERALWTSSGGGGMTVSGTLAVSGVISGDGSGLTALNAGNVGSGTLANARLPGTMSGKTFSGGITFSGGLGANAWDLSKGIVLGGGGEYGFGVTSGRLNVNVSNSGAIYFVRGQTDVASIRASGFWGQGANITDLNAGNLGSGTVPNARISGAYSGFTDLTASGTIAAATVQGAGIRVVGSGTAANPAIWLSGTRDLGLFFVGNSGVGITVGGLVRFYADNEVVAARNGAVFDGDGGGLSNVPASALTGTVATARLPTSATTAQWVGERYAALAEDAIGSICFLGRNSGNAEIVPGTNYAGSTLHYSGAFQGGGAADVQGLISTSLGPSGTWKAMGRTTGNENNPNYAATTFKRIA